MPEQDLCPSLQQCQKRHARWPGTWHLAPQRAISLMPRQASQILIVQGCAWITWPSKAGGSPAAAQDVFLAPGQMLDVPAGVHLVMESVDARQALDFDWRALPAGLVLSAPHAAASLPALWTHWAQAWLQLALASGHLLQGLVRHQWRAKWRSAKWRSVRQGTVPDPTA